MERINSNKNRNLNKIFLILLIFTILLLPSIYSAGDPWWDTNYKYRQVLNITTTASIPTQGLNGYSVSFTIDTTSNTYFLDSGDDLRIVFWNGTNNVELDRINESNFNSATTQIWFKLQKNIVASSYDDEYYIYYGNPYALNPPKDKNKVYLFFDDYDRTDISDITAESEYSATEVGIWSIESNQLKNIGGSSDPNKLLIAALGNSVYPVIMETDIKVTNWAADNDLGRMGLSSQMDSTGGGYDMLFHQDHNSLDFLNDLRSWGTNTNTGWANNIWYVMKFNVLTPASKNGQYKFWQKTNSEPGSWTNINFGTGAARNSGYVGFAGSRQSDTTYFDNLKIRYYHSNEPIVSKLTRENVPSNPPNIPIINLNSTDGSHSSLVNLNCSTIITDPNEDKINVSVSWYKNSILYSTINYFNSYSSGSNFFAILDSTNTSVSDIWTCSLKLYDYSSSSNWTNSSSFGIGESKIKVEFTPIISTLNVSEKKLFPINVKVTCLVEYCGEVYVDLFTKRKDNLYLDNFESGFGNWANTAGDNYDWTRDNGGTPTANTGPSVDHTLGTAAGYYLYGEADGRSTNQYTYLLGPKVNVSSIDDLTLNFWYHLYGATMGRLSVDIYHNGGWINDIWTRNNNQGNTWFNINLNLSAYTGNNIQTRFRGIRGSGTTSDFAIDDVSFSVIRKFYKTTNDTLDIPFYINGKDRLKSSQLDVGESETLTFYLNASGELNSIHNLFGYATLGYNPLVTNTTSILNITILANSPPSAPNNINASPIPTYQNNLFLVNATGSYDADLDLITYEYKFFNLNDSTLLVDWTINNNYTIKTTDVGDSIRVYARAIASGDISPEYYQDFYIEENAIILINLLYPNNNTKIIITNDILELKYNISSIYSNLNCSLFLNGIYNRTENCNNGDNYINITVTKGNYNWYIIVNNSLSSTNSSIFNFEIIKNYNSFSSKKISSINTDLYKIELNIKNKMNWAKNIIPIEFIESKFNFGSFSLMYDWLDINSGVFNGKNLGWDLNINNQSNQDLNYSITKNSQNYELHKQYVIGLD